MNVCVQTIVLLDRTQIYIYMIETLHAFYSRKASCTKILHFYYMSRNNQVEIRL